MEIRTILNSQGQTSVEYILLMAVIISLAVTFFNSEVYLRYFGENGRIAQTFKLRMETNYRHAYDARDANTAPFYEQIRTHQSYVDPIGGGSRFFIPRDPYPGP